MVVLSDLLLNFAALRLGLLIVPGFENEADLLSTKWTFKLFVGMVVEAQQALTAKGVSARD